MRRSLVRTSSSVSFALGMSRLHTVLSFFALPVEQQIELLPEMPRDRGASDYYTSLPHNPLLLLVRGVSDEYSQPESESRTPDIETFENVRFFPQGDCLMP